MELRGRGAILVSSCFRVVGKIDQSDNTCEYTVEMAIMHSVCQCPKPMHYQIYAISD
jgi:hypothetical protein